MTTSTQKPTAHVRLGSIQAAIWRQPADQGRVRYGATFERLYVDADGNWKSASSFGRDELLTLAKVADLANTEIHALQAKDREATRAHAENANGRLRT